MSHKLRRYFFLSMGVALGLLTAPLVLAAPVAKMTPQSAEKAERSVGERVLTELLAKIGRPRIQVRVNFGNDGELNELKARTQIPLMGEISIPLQSPSGNPQVDKLIPTAAIKTRGVVVRWTANTDAAGKVISNEVTFHNNEGAAIPLVLTLRSELTDLLDLRIESIKVNAAGIDAASTDIVVDASCGLKQSVVELKTGRIAWQDSTCTFKGKYIKDAKKLTYRFVFDSF